MYIHIYIYICISPRVPSEVAEAAAEGGVRLPLLHEARGPIEDEDEHGRLGLGRAPGGAGKQRGDTGRGRAHSSRQAQARGDERARAGQ